MDQQLFFDRFIWRRADLNLTMKAWRVDPVRGPVGEGASLNVLGTFMPSSFVAGGKTYPVIVRTSDHQTAEGEGEERYPVHLHVDWANVREARMVDVNLSSIKQKHKIEFWNTEPATVGPLFWFYITLTEEGLEVFKDCRTVSLENPRNPDV
jgi:hypothetical protein